MKYLLFSVALMAATSAFAVQPDEILSDSGLEVRARALSGGLRERLVAGYTGQCSARADPMLDCDLADAPGLPL